MRKKGGTGESFCRLIHRKALDSACLFRFEMARKEARELLRLAALRQKISILNYCILPGEMIILVDASSEKTASLARSLFAMISKTHNIRKHHQGSCWKGRPNIALIQKNGLLSASLSAIDMLPVARKFVGHPSEWECSGFQELAGIRRRYRIIDRRSICRLSGFENYTDFSRQHLSLIKSLLGKDDINSFPFDAMAVGYNLEIMKIAHLLPRKLREIRKCKIIGGLDAEALFVSKRRGDAVIRNI
jgi:hypothetical protein